MPNPTQLIAFGLSYDPIPTSIGRFIVRQVNEASSEESESDTEEKYLEIKECTSNAICSDRFSNQSPESLYYIKNEKNSEDFKELVLTFE